ncbi:MAG: DUF2939 domain-containing protein [Acinetobacter sp.]
MSQVKKISIVIFSVLFLFIAWWFVSPYWMLYQLKQAYEEHRSDQIAQYIDYDAVKSSLQPQIVAALSSNDISKHDSWYQLIRGLLNSQITNQALNLVVSPETIMLLMQGQKLTELMPKFQQSIARESAKNVFEANTPTISSNALVNEKSKYHAAYRDINTFVLYVSRSDHQSTQFIFNRRGWQWKMVAIDLALNKH